jgi:hypothetical protein
MTRGHRRNYTILTDATLRGACFEAALMMRRMRDLNARKLPFSGSELPQ